MNFYKHYIGDFQRDTGHLSLTERGAYLSLMHHYYATERPLPADHAALCRVAGAITKVERDAVRVAMRFFKAVESGLMHTRIEAEIEKAGKQADTNKRIAEEREARRKAEREADEASTNRATNREPNQTPDTRHQSLSNPDGLEVVSDAADHPTLQLVRPPIPDCPQQRLIEAYHEILPMARQVREWNGTFAGYMRSRWRDKAAELRWKSADEGVEWFRSFFTYVSRSAFLTGRAKVVGDRKPFLLSLEWLMRPTNWAKVIEGAYE